jgi:Skp family chaperone for outer membrane proteins
VYFVKFMIVIIAIITWHTAGAAVYKCKSPDGKTSYSENQCAGDSPITTSTSDSTRDLTDNKVPLPVSNQENQINEQASNTKNLLRIGFVNIWKLAEKNEPHQHDEAAKKLRDSFNEYQNLLILTTHTDIMYVDKKLDLTEAIIEDNYRAGENTKKKLNNITKNLKVGFVNTEAAVNESGYLKAMNKKLENEFSQSGKEGRLDAMKLKTRQIQEMEKSAQHIKKIITSIGQDEKFDLILITDVTYASNQVDITNKVKQKLNLQ